MQDLSPPSTPPTRSFMPREVNFAGGQLREDDGVWSPSTIAQRKKDRREETVRSMTKRFERPMGLQMAETLCAIGEEDEDEEA